VSTWQLFVIKTNGRLVEDIIFNAFVRYNTHGDGGEGLVFVRKRPLLLNHSLRSSMSVGMCNFVSYYCLCVLCVRDFCSKLV
jgi:hypothetical protein